jgi:hypothetical protein
MIKENPEDSVRDEQNGAELNAAGTEENPETDKAEENDTSVKKEITEEDVKL